MTEEEARQKLCPFVATPEGKCVASGCMSWLPIYQGFKDGQTYFTSGSRDHNGRILSDPITVPPGGDKQFFCKCWHAPSSGGHT